MSWNLESHILDHSAYIVNNLKEGFDPSDKKNQHFTLSIDHAQLIVNHSVQSQENIDKIIVNFLKDLEEHTHTFIESKGRRNGKQIFREKQLDFKDCLMAYHNSGSDSINSQNYDVLPHVHLLFDKSKKLGIGFFQLRQALNEVSQRHGLVFNFQEESKEKDTSLKKEVSNFSWMLKRSSDIDFLKRISEDKIKEDLEKIAKHYKATGNLQYYIKVMRDLQARLKRQDIDFTWRGTNLKEDFPIFLSDKQKSDLKILHKGEDRKEIYRIISDRDNQIGRSWLEANEGFKPLIIDELEKRGVTFHKISDLDFERVKLKIERKGEKKKDFFKSINHCYREDFLKAASVSKNEKELQDLMIKMGYKSFAYKQKNVERKDKTVREKVGFTFKNKNDKSVTVYFSNLKIDLKDVRGTLKENNESEKDFSDERKEVYSHLKNYKPKEVKSNNEYFEEIYKFDISHDLSSYYISEDVESVKMMKKGSFIEDCGNRLLTRSSNENLEESIEIMLEIARSKGWDLNKIEVTGSQRFKDRVREEIELLKKRELEEEFKEEGKETEKETETEISQGEDKDRVEDKEDVLEGDSVDIEVSDLETEVRKDYEKILEEQEEERRRLS